MEAGLNLFPRSSKKGLIQVQWKTADVKVRVGKKTTKAQECTDL